MAQILEIAQEGTLKTQIMYRANLSFTQLNEYLQFLLLNNLIARKKSEGRAVYSITLKGSSFLQTYGELLQLLKTEIRAPKVEVSRKKRLKSKP